LLARKALSAVARVHGRFGLTAAAKLLKGRKDPRLERAGLDQLKTFGLLKDEEESWIVRLLRRCVTAGWVSFSTGDRPVVLLTPGGNEVMAGRLPARFLPPPRHVVAATSTRKRQARLLETEELDESARILFEALRAHRLQVARDLQVLPYVVASDRTLRDLARQRPRTREELLAIYGIGPSRVAAYGDGFLEVIASSG
jgi:ATP-dependent DNA helicase RecQ